METVPPVVGARRLATIEVAVGAPRTTLPSNGAAAGGGLEVEPPAAPPEEPVQLARIAAREAARVNEAGGRGILDLVSGRIEPRCRGYQPRTRAKVSIF